jgi:threonine synthase
MQGVAPTLSPSMDIQVSSNAERLLFELNDRDGGLTAEQLTRFRATGSLALEPDQHAQLNQQFAGGRVDDDATLAEMRHQRSTTGQVLDPHTAVGTLVARQFSQPGIPMVTMATAHPAKFPDAVRTATGIDVALPDHLADLFARPECNSVDLPNDIDSVMAHVRAVRR